MFMPLFPRILEQLVRFKAITTFLLVRWESLGQVVLYAVAQVQKMLPVKLEFPADPGRTLALGYTTQD